MLNICLLPYFIIYSTIKPRIQIQGYSQNINILFISLFRLFDMSREH